MAALEHCLNARPARGQGVPRLALPIAHHSPQSPVSTAKPKHTVYRVVSVSIFCLQSCSTTTHTPRNKQEVLSRRPHTLGPIVGVATRLRWRPANDLRKHRPLSAWGHVCRARRLCDHVAADSPAAAHSPWSIAAIHAPATVSSTIQHPRPLDLHR